MKRLLASAAALMLIASCGVKKDASPLEVFPESAFVMCAMSDPAAVAATIDGYIEQGVPIAGPGLLSKQICEEAGVTSLDSITVMTGIDVHGTVVFYVCGLNPQTIGGAVSVPDARKFWAKTAEWGADWTDVEAIGRTPVRTFTSGDMTVFVSTYRGLALFAGSRDEISSMIDRIEGRVPRGEVTIDPSSAWTRIDISMIGPMASGQLNMYRPQILSGMQSGMTGNPMEATMQRMAGLYLDAASLFLLEARDLEHTVTFGPENMEVHSRLTFNPGSSLEGLLQPVEAFDHLSSLPAGGVMAGRFSMPPAAVRAAMNAVMSALGIEADQEYLDFSSEMAENAAFVMYGDHPMHFMCIYDLPDGSDLEDAADWVQYSLDFSRGIMQGMEGITFSAPRDTVMDGATLLTYGMVMDQAAMMRSIADSSLSSPSPIGLQAWLAISGDMLLLEVAPEPDLIMQIAGGGFSGETMAGNACFAAAGTDKEMVFGVDLPAYMAMVGGMMGEGMGFDAGALSAASAWMYNTIDLTDRGVVCVSTVDGGDLAKMIAILATSSGPGAFTTTQ